MNKRRNYRILWWALILGSFILDLVATRMDQGAGGDVLRYVGAVMIAVGVVPLVVRAKPKVMEDKPAPSGQE
jgi:hypothetical protein